MFKMQVQDDANDPRSWHDVTGQDGSALTFASESEARARLAALYPVQVKMEQFTGPKTSRVIAILGDDPK